jgi:hypothetical protein
MLSSGRLGLKGFLNQVELTEHQAIRMNLPRGLETGFGQGFEETLPIPVSVEDGFPPVAMIQDTIDHAGIPGCGVNSTCAKGCSAAAGQPWGGGWWGYCRLAEERKPLERMDGWIRRHIRKCFWQRWHGWKGRVKALRRLGIRGRLLGGGRSGRGAWRMARHPVMQKALNNRPLRRYGFLCFADLSG